MTRWIGVDHPLNSAERALDGAERGQFAVRFTRPSRGVLWRADVRPTTVFEQERAVFEAAGQQLYDAGPISGDVERALLSAPSPRENDRLGARSPHDSWTYRQAGIYVGGMGRRGALRDGDVPRAEGEAAPYLVLVGDPFEGEPYEPLRDQTLLPAFAQLSESPTPRAIRRFASQYGWLTEPEHLQEIASPSRVTLGEPLSVWRRELARFRSIWRPARAVLSPRLRTSRAYLAEHLTERGSGWWSWHESYGDETESKTTLHTYLDTELELPGDLMGAARAYVAGLVNGQLRGRVSPVLLPQHHDAIRFQPEDLIATIHLLLAFRLQGRQAAERTCDNPACGRPILEGRADRKYCSDACRMAHAYRRRTAQKEGFEP